MSRNENPSTRVLSAQLRVSDTDLSSHRIDDIRHKIDAAIQLAGLNRILFQQTSHAEINRKIVDHCRQRGIEIFMWYQLLGDNDCIPTDDEMMQDAFGARRMGDTGSWHELMFMEDPFLAACPTNRNYNRVIFERAKRRLEHYDGIFLDAIGYPLPSLGVESMFTCFCPNCMAQEPALAGWRNRVYEFKERFIRAADDDLEKWETLYALFTETGLNDFFTYRTGLITKLVEAYAGLARRMEKGVGIDVLAPGLAFLAGHDYEGLGRLTDWLKPRIYCNSFGPSSIPLEFYCLTLGLKSWGKRMSIPGVMDFVSRTLGVEPPSHLHLMRNSFLSDAIVADQVDKALAAGGAVLPGIECSLHPEFDTNMDEQALDIYLRATERAEGIVLCWNLLYIPDAFLSTVGYRRGFR